MDLSWAALCILIGVCALFYIGSLALCLSSDESDVPGGVDTTFTWHRAAPNSGEGGKAQHHYHNSRQENKGWALTSKFSLKKRGIEYISLTNAPFPPVPASREGEGRGLAQSFLPQLRDALVGELGHEAHEHQLQHPVQQVPVAVVV